MPHPSHPVFISVIPQTGQKSGTLRHVVGTGFHHALVDLARKSEFGRLISRRCTEKVCRAETSRRTGSRSGPWPWTGTTIETPFVRNPA